MGATSSGSTPTMRKIHFVVAVLLSTVCSLKRNILLVSAATAADQHCGADVVVKARDKRLAGTFQRMGDWGGQPWYRKSDSTMTMYWTGHDAATGLWILGTTLGVRDLNNRIMARRTGNTLPCKSHMYIVCICSRLLCLALAGKYTVIRFPLLVFVCAFCRCHSS